MYCNHCGKEVRAGAKYCNHCGSEIVEIKPNKTRKILITAIVSLLCLTVLIGAGYFSGLFDRLHAKDGTAQTEQTDEAQAVEPAFDPPENALDSMTEIVSAGLYHCYANNLDSWDASCINREEANQILSFYVNESFAVNGAVPVTDGGRYIISEKDLMAAGYALFYDFDGLLTDTSYLKKHDDTEGTYAVITGDVGDEGFEVVLDHEEKNSDGSVDAVYQVNFRFSPSLFYSVRLIPDLRAGKDSDESLRYYYRVQKVTKEEAEPERKKDAVVFLGKPLVEAMSSFGREYQTYEVEGGMMVYYGGSRGVGFGFAGTSVKDDAVITMIDSYGGNASIYAGLTGSMTFPEMKKTMNRIGVTIPEPVFEYDVLAGEDNYTVSFSDPNNEYHFVVIWKNDPETSAPARLFVKSA